MSDKLIPLATIILLLLPLASAFELFKGSEPSSLCPSSTGIFIDVVEDAQEELTLTKSGSASLFTTLFLYKNQIYAYVTPKSTTQAGLYGLTITASSSSESKSITHNPKVIECQLFDMTIDKSSVSLCPCESGTLELTLENIGKYADTYQLSVSGPASELILLSQDSISLLPSEKKKIIVYVQDTCNEQGEKEFTITATPKKARTQKSITSSMHVEACYDFSTTLEKTSTQICAGTKEAIALNIKNEGTTQNTYNLNIAGPAWAHLQNTQLTIKPNQEATTQLVLNPPYKAKDLHDIDLEITSDKGNFRVNSSIKTEIIQCVGVGIEVDQSEIPVCMSEEYFLPLTIKNTGSLDQEFIVAVEGPTWVSLDKGSLQLKNKESQEVILSITPLPNISSKGYEVTIKVNPKGVSSISEEKSIILNTLTPSECYKVSLKAEKSSIQVAQDTTVTIPITIENNGAYESSYEVFLSGSALDFSELVPLSTGIALSPGSVEQIYLYLTPSPDIEPGSYTAVISIKLEDSEILAEESMQIEVTQEPELLLEDLPEINLTLINETKQEDPSIFQKIGLFFRGLFSSDNSKQESNLTENQIWLEGASSPKKITLEDERVVTQLDFYEQPSYTYSTKVGELVSLKVDGTLYASSLDSVTESQIKLVITPGPISVYLEPYESKHVDLDQDSLSDLLISIEDTESVLITYKQLEGEEKIEVVQEKEDLGLGEDTVFLDSEGKPLETAPNPEGRSDLEEKGPLGKLADYVIQNKTGVLIVLGALLAVALLIKLKMPKKVVEPRIKQEPAQKQEVVKETSHEEKKESKPIKDEVKQEKKEPVPTKKEEKKGDDDDEEFEIIH